YNANQGVNRSATVNNIPTDGRTIHVRLWSAINAVWQFRDVTYTAAPFGSGGAPAQISSPTPGSTFSSSLVTFSWTSGTGVTQYWLYVGSSQGASDIYNANQGVNRSAAVNNIPTDSRTIHVRLWSAINAVWQFRDVSYTAASFGSGGTAALITSPTPGSTFS